MLEFSSLTENDKKFEFIYEFNVSQCNDRVVASIDKQKTLMTLVGQSDVIKIWLSQIFAPFVFISRNASLSHLISHLQRIANYVIAHDVDDDKYIAVKSKSCLFVKTDDDLRHEYGMKSLAIRNAVENGDKEVHLALDHLSYMLKISKSLEEVAKVVLDSVIVR